MPNKGINILKSDIIVVCVCEYIITKPHNNNKSLTKLNENALKLDFRVDLLDDQKLIKKNDVNPISSHPKNKVKKLLENIKINILYIKLLIQKTNPISSASFLK